MNSYRKIPIFHWHEGSLRELSDDGKLVFLFLLTHPNLTALGTLRAWPSELTCELGWSLERLQATLSEASLQNEVRWDEQTPLAWLPRVLKYRPPRSSSGVWSWRRAFVYLPPVNCKKRSVPR